MPKTGKAGSSTGILTCFCIALRLAAFVHRHECDRTRQPDVQLPCWHAVHPSKCVDRAAFECSVLHGTRRALGYSNARCTLLPGSSRFHCTLCQLRDTCSMYLEYWLTLCLMTVAGVTLQSNGM
jgi:hypothetical protein